MNPIRTKVEQAFQLLKVMNIDLWMIYCRESEHMTDPSLGLVVGEDIMAKGAFLYTQSGEAIAFVWKFDAQNIIRSGVFDRVLTYTNQFAADFKALIESLNPQKIALNYSTSSVTADGLSHGMYLGLKNYLQDTPYINRFISSQELLFALRSIKTETEINNVAKAAEVSDIAWQNALPHIKPGMSEKQVADLLKANISAEGSQVSFPAIVNAGTKTVPGHGSPTDARLAPGDLLHVDFGAKVNGYCADIQRVAYLKKEGQDVVPEALTRAFDTVLTAIDKAARLYQTGQKGCEVDAVARKVLTDAGYPEYQHSLGHQLGQQVHDGGARVGPVLEPSDPTPHYPLKAGNVFTVELGIQVDGIGYVGLEEDLVVTDDGGKFLANRQEQLAVIDAD